MLRRILGAGLVILYITPALALSQLCSDENMPIPGLRRTCVSGLGALWHREEDWNFLSLVDTNTYCCWTSASCGVEIAHLFRLLALATIRHRFQSSPLNIIDVIRCCTFCTSDSSDFGETPAGTLADSDDDV